MKTATLVLTFLTAIGLSAQQPQPGVTAPTPQEQAQEAERKRAETQPRHDPAHAKVRAEASEQELKVSPEDVKKEVTDANKASNIIGMKVVNRQNEDLGKVKDLVIDLESGEVAYAVISAGRTGFFGTSSKMIAVPISALTAQPGEDGFVIDADKQRLEQAQGFSEQDWPAIDAAQESTVGLTPGSAPANQKQPAGDRNRQALDPNRTRERDR